MQTIMKNGHPWYPVSDPNDPYIWELETKKFSSSAERDNFIEDIKADEMYSYVSSGWEGDNKYWLCTYWKVVGKR